MTVIQVQIVRWVDNYQPGIVECQFTDAHGRIWSFIEKLPIITDADLDESSTYPQPGMIACQVVSRAGSVVTVDTIRPWGVESVDGASRFEVFADSLSDWEPF